MSDIHLAYDNIDKLLTWHEDHAASVLKHKYDFIIAAGDFGNVNHKVEEGKKYASALEMVEA